MACQPGWLLGGAVPPAAWADSRVTATYRSAWQGAVKLVSLAYRVLLLDRAEGGRRGEQRLDP